MIECEICGNYFHVDDIKNCPECDMELCPSCYEKHVVKCMAEKYNFDDGVEEESTIPRICPKCQEELELDIDPDGSVRVYCSNCDFVEELDEEQLAELNQCEDYGDEDENEEENCEDMTKEDMLKELNEHNWPHELTDDSSWDEVKEEYDIMIDECTGDSSLFPNGRDYDAEDEDGPF